MVIPCLLSGKPPGRDTMEATVEMRWCVVVDDEVIQSFKDISCAAAFAQGYNDMDTKIDDIVDKVQPKIISETCLLCNGDGCHSCGYTGAVEVWESYD